VGSRRTGASDPPTGRCVRREHDLPAGKVARPECGPRKQRILSVAQGRAGLRKSSAAPSPGGCQACGRRRFQLRHAGCTRCTVVFRQKGRPRGRLARDCALCGRDKHTSVHTVRGETEQPSEGTQLRSASERVRAHPPLVSNPALRRYASARIVSCSGHSHRGGRVRNHVKRQSDCEPPVASEQREPDGVAGLLLACLRILTPSLPV
jgi:hypothetical protein